MEKTINIYDAIKQLPDSLITPEIYEAGINEGKIELLNILPKEYLTDDNINRILDKSKDSYSYRGFSLSAIPVQGRSQKVCEMAVKKSLDNYREVPVEKRSNDMLLQIVQYAEKFIHFLPLVPASTWDKNAIYNGITSIYSSGSNNSYNRYHSNNTQDNKNRMRLIQIFLSYVPEYLKTKAFYWGLFNTSMSVSDIDFLTPNKYKNEEYYIQMGKKDIEKVPVSKLGYNVLKAALLSNKNGIYVFLDDRKNIKEKLFAVIDDEIADIIVKKSPMDFDDLPEKFWNKSRLILALDNLENSYQSKHIYSKLDTTKFDDEICRAIIRKDSCDTPEFARGIWTPDFIDYCLENAKSYCWFEKMPKELQTQEMVDIILGSRINFIECALPQFITYDLAIKAFAVKDSWRGTHTLEEYIPKHYFDDFTMDTGLPKEFFGGETSYSKLKEKKENYTYCHIGDCYLGFFIDKDGREEYNRLMMTRRTPMQIRPSIVFSRVIGTFHKTWLEKLVADNDPQFVKPVPESGTKSKQINPYLNVKTIETIDGIKVYGHSLLGETVLFTAEKDSIAYETTTLESMREQFKKAESETVYEEAC